VVEWQRDVSDPNEFLSTLKVDLYPEEVYTFTPKGKVLVLPRESTPIDFAYSIHTEVGHSCTGAKVNGRMVPLRHKLHSGDIVEVITQPGHKPSRDWLAIVKSSRARNKIKHWLNVHQRERAIEIGTQADRKEARKYRISLKDIKEADLQRAASDYGLGRPDDLMAGIGYGKYSARQVLAKFAPAGAEPMSEPKSRRRPRLHQRRAPRFRRRQQQRHRRPRIRRPARLSRRCCNPIRGEAIVGYVTRGKGVAVHSVQLSQRHQSSLRARAPHRRACGPATKMAAGFLSRKNHAALRRPLRHVETNHRGHQRHQHQHPQHRSPQPERPGQRGRSPGNRRPQTPPERIMDGVATDSGRA
jgi:guanosine-3',5'-bis(diphosphate) 3'-pyrophosphohydrolase